MINELHMESLKADFKGNMKGTKLMLNSQSVEGQVMTGNKTVEAVEECTYLGQAIRANQAHEREIRRLGME